MVVEAEVVAGMKSTRMRNQITSSARDETRDPEDEQHGAMNRRRTARLWRRIDARCGWRDSDRRVGTQREPERDYGCRQVEPCGDEKGCRDANRADGVMPVASARRWPRMLATDGAHPRWRVVSAYDGRRREQRQRRAHDGRGHDEHGQRDEERVSVTTSKSSPIAPCQGEYHDGNRARTGSEVSAVRAIATSAPANHRNGRRARYHRSSRPGCREPGPP